MYYMLDNQKTRKRPWSTKRPTVCRLHKQRTPHLIVLHTAECHPDFHGTDDAGENLAKWSVTQKRVSWHATVDADSIIPMLPDSYRAWHVRGGYNDCGLGVEIATEAAKWPYAPEGWVTSVLDQLSDLVLDWSAKHHIPTAVITDPSSFGIITHALLDPKRRTDPGRDFPWNQFKGLLAKKGLLPTAEPSIIDEPSVKDGVKRRLLLKIEALKKDVELL